MESDYLALDYTIDEENPIPHLGDIITKIKPDWSKLELKHKIFTDGISNKLIGCYVSEKFSAGDVILIRIYGKNTDIFIDRNQEVLSMCALYNVGCGPKVYAKFNNGICYEFLHGEVGTETMIRDPKYSELIAKEIARLHCLKVPTSTIPNNGPCAFRNVRKWLESVPDSYSNQDYQRRYLKEFPGGKVGIGAELELLEKQLNSLGCNVVLSHNDILIKNLVLNNNCDRIYLIDYEYTDYNYEPFDIGNHFAEFAGIDEIDHTLYPSREFQLVWLRHYLCHRAIFRGEASGQGDAALKVTDEQVEKLYIEANMFSLASHMFWAVWGLIQARYSALDFDFMTFAVCRYSEYLARRDERLALGNKLHK